MRARVCVPVPLPYLYRVETYTIGYYILHDKCVYVRVCAFDSVSKSACATVSMSR